MEIGKDLKEAMEAAGFRSGAPVFMSRAPGRLDVLGGVGDYSGCTVLEMPLAAATHAAAQAREDNRLVLHSVSPGGRVFHHEAAVEEWVGTYRAVARRFSGEERWAAYIGGALTVLERERGVKFRHGATLAAVSGVPLGAGVSSSAALEVAAMTALAAVYGVQLDGLELAKLCQTVENRVVGAPCGIMDQATSALGKADHLLVLKCQPATVLGYATVPPGWRFYGIDSAVKHSVGGRHYTRARVAAFMAWQILRDRTPLQPPGGYLANLAPDEFRTHVAPILPRTMTGQAFLDRYGDWPDPVTMVDPDESYPVRDAAEHPVLENERVARLRAIMKGADTEACRITAGGILYAAHFSYSHRLNLGSGETDLLVRLVKERGPARGLYGARITGGGSGGTVAVLADAHARPAVVEVLDAYRAQTGLPAQLIEGTSDGAAAYGARDEVIRR